MGVMLAMDCVCRCANRAHITWPAKKEERIKMTNECKVCHPMKNDRLWEVAYLISHQVIDVYFPLEMNSISVRWLSTSAWADTCLRKHTSQPCTQQETAGTQESDKIRRRFLISERVSFEKEEHFPAFRNGASSEKVHYSAKKKET